MTWAVEDRINLIIARFFTEISPFSPDLQYSTVPSNKKYQQGLRCLLTSCQARDRIPGEILTQVFPVCVTRPATEIDLCIGYHLKTGGAGWYPTVIGNVC